MRNLIAICLLFISISGIAQKDKKNTSIYNPADAAKFTLAKQNMYAGDFVGALNQFREVEKNNPNDDKVKYYIGFCQFNLGQFANAKEVLLKAVELNPKPKPETHFVLGKILQKEENYDKAIEHLTLYKNAATSDKESNEDADVLLQQCQNAKALKANPLPVEITNLGADINSKWDDKNPCITADGKKMVFTTRRPETTNDEVDIEGDGKYFENIYLSSMDSVSRNWGKAAGFGSPINTKTHDACTSISPDGKQIFIYKNGKDKQTRGGNVFVSKVNKDKWKAPESLGKPINTSYWEGGVCVSPDGKRYFFFSERPGGYGHSDIWMVEKKSKTEWGEPVNLGPDVNTPYDEAGMFLSPDGKTLFFCSNGPLSMGDYDILKTVYENNAWTKPVNVGYPINSSAREGQLTISADARYAYFSSNRQGGLGEADIYKVDLKDYAILEKDGKKVAGNGLSILRGTIRDGFEGYGIQDVEIKVTDEKDALVASTTTNENGEYFFTMRGGKYKLQVSKKGFTDITDSIEIGSSTKETIIVEKGYLLKK